MGYVTVCHTEPTRVERKCGHFSPRLVGSERRGRGGMVTAVVTAMPSLDARVEPSPV